MSDQNNVNRPVAQAGNVTFELHTLGWEAFQNLCGHIAREILGQTVTVFSPSNDAGQDGAFQGVWQRTKQEAFSGRFVIQCKFTARRDEHLSLSDLGDEFLKAEKLARSGIAQTYLLMSNAKITGESDKAIREAFNAIKEINHFDVLGSEWLTQQILASKRLRAFVPRIYGLGDLTQILDERVYRQADEILRTWKDNLAKFVPTEAHHKSVKALLHEGFVLLLGDPMAGKSTIAAALALAAADQSNCVPVFITHPNDFKAHWNPDEPKQFFWVDDAFGQTQFEPTLAEGWNRIFPLLTAALQNGTRVLFTSRTYIYQAAQRHLKQTAFPLLGKSQVVIEVEKLSAQEKERILYNHLRLGTQPPEFRTGVKPFLPSIAANPKFFPEVARRLGNPFFTKNLHSHPENLKQFVEEPKEFLGDIIQQLNPDNFAALALLFMRAGRVAIPLKVESEELDAMAQLGADVAQLREALLSLEGNLVALVFEEGERSWKFRHPSIRDAMATHVAARPDLIDIYLGGVKAPELLREVVCGDVEIAGAKVHVPRSRFSIAVSKLRGIDIGNWGLRYSLLSFLTSRCSPDFLPTWYAVCSEDLETLISVCSVGDYTFCLLLTRLHSVGCLPEKHRSAFVAKAVQEAVDSGESTFLLVRELLTPSEFASALGAIRSELVPALESMIERMAGKYTDPQEDPADYFLSFSNDLEGFRELFSELDDSEMVDAFDYGERQIQSAIQDLEELNRRRQAEEKRKKEEAERKEESDAQEQEWLEAMVTEYERDASEAPTQPPEATSRFRPTINAPLRSIFDDVDS